MLLLKRMTQQLFAKPFIPHARFNIFVLMTHFFHFRSFCLLTLVAWLLSAPVYAQMLPATSAVGEAKPQSEPAPAADPLGRNNPRGTVTGYIQAVARGDYLKASQYLDINLKGIAKTKRDARSQQIAKRLQRILDQNGKMQANSLISEQPDGDDKDGLDPGVDNVGSFKLEGKTFPVFVEKTTTEEGARVWLFSSKTLDELPEEETERIISINTVLPVLLVENELWGVPLGHWLTMLVLMVVSYFVAKLLTMMLTSTLYFFWKQAESERHTGIIAAFALPIRIYVAVWIFVLSADKMGISIVVRQYFSNATVIVAGVSLLFLGWSLIDVFSSWCERYMLRHGNYGALSAVRFFKRSVKFLVIAIGIITTLDTIGLNVTTGLAAFGIGGIALALGAQKTVENLVGSLSVIFDQPVRVGDFCKVGDILGTIEEVGMRSTRIRTNERTLVTIPNGEFSSLRIENYNKRDKFWFHPTLGLRYETTPKQLRHVLRKLHEMLATHSQIEEETVRVRFLGFGADSLNIDIFAYVRAMDYNGFLEVQEGLNLQIMDIIDEAGTAFAFASRTVYITREKGLPTPAHHTSASAKHRSR